MSGNFIYRHHVEPQSQTLLAERRIIPYSTEVHWRYQNYSYEFGCQAGEAHRRLLECRWVKRLVGSLDKFHSVYSIGRKTSRRIYVVRVEMNEETAYIQGQIIYGQSSGSQWESMPSWRRSKSGPRKGFTLKTLENCEEYISSTRRIQEFKETIKNARKKLETSVAPAMPCKIMKNCGSGGSNKIKTKLVCILEADESTRMRMGNSIPRYHQDHIARKERIHYSTTIWFTNLFLCLKLWKFRQQRQQWTRNGKNWRSFRRGTWRKSEVKKKCSMKQERPALQFILLH